MLEDILRVRSRRSLAEFVKQAWHVLNPTTKLVWGPPMQAISDHAQALWEGRIPKNNLILNCPPGVSKSTIISVCLPAWIWLQDPSARMLFASGSEKVALRDSMLCRDLLKSDWYQRFGIAWTFSDSQDAKGLFKNSAQGWRAAISAGAKIVGIRADILICDDPNDVTDAFSKPALESVQIWWDTAAANRLNDLVTGKRCIIQQRVAPGDLTGHCLSKQPEAWEVLTMRQVMEDEDVGKVSVIGWEDKRQPGQLLFPERFPQSVLDGERARMGPIQYAGQHQQRPMVADGNMFKLGWFAKRWKRSPDGIHYEIDGKKVRMETVIKFLSVDFAMGTKTVNDYTVISEFGVTPDKEILWLDCLRIKEESPDIVKTLEKRWEKGGLKYMICEATANGDLIIKILQRAGITVKAVKPTKDKVTRAVPLSVLVESGRFILPEEAHWLDIVINEFISFPSPSVHDDCLDTASQAGDELNNRMSASTTPLKISLGTQRVFG